MNSRERVLSAYNFSCPDKLPVEFYYAPVGYYEHGEKLNDLFESCPGDFEPFVRKEIPVLGPQCFDKDGRYHEKKTDEWGTTWEYRIFGIAGIECEYPLDDIEKFSTYKLPDLPDWVTDEKAFLKAKEEVSKHKSEYFCRRENFSLFERLISLRPFEDVLCDLICDDEYILQLLDKMTEYYEKKINSLIKMGVDSVYFGDDFGTNDSLIISPDLFRAHFKPRYQRLMKPLKDAGVKIHFHSCGKVDALFPDLAELGIDSIWPQIPLYDMNTLADTLRDMKIAIAIHTDRAQTMTYKKPDDVRELFKREYDAFRPDKGGAWFYVEVDNGMPFENVKALVDEIRKYR